MLMGEIVIGCHGDISDLNSPGLCVLLFMYAKLCFLSLALREAMSQQNMQFFNKKSLSF